ncbi:hypothetical protein BDV06DRAFT_179632 [Aspergillus oleicola]
MGHKLSAVNGVRSENYTEPGNAINEIWIGNTEIISRLPFGDNDMEQAGWPTNGMPKIPWHNFIIPMKRDLQVLGNDTGPVNICNMSNVTVDRIVWCNPIVCITVQGPHEEITALVKYSDAAFLINAIAWTVFAYLYLLTPQRARRNRALVYEPVRTHNRRDVTDFGLDALMTTVSFAVGIGLSFLSVWLWAQARHFCKLSSWDWQLVQLVQSVVGLFLFYRTVLGARVLGNIWKDWWRMRRDVVRQERRSKERLEEECLCERSLLEPC